MDYLKDIVNIIFFTVMSIVAVLSYLQARKTLFSPIKTEVFKLQIESFQDVIRFFNKQNQHDFDQTFSFHSNFEFNVERMQRAYINTFFPGEIDLSGGDSEFHDQSPCYFIATEEEIEELGERTLLGCPIEVEKKQVTGIDEPAIRLANWNEYRLLGLHYNEAFSKQIEKLTKIAASPVLPKELTDLLYGFIENVNHNFYLIKDVIEDSASEMTIKYPTADDVIEFRSDWIWNKFNSQRINLEEAAAKILSFVYSHLKVNEVMK
jgi:hypothetical protein